MATTSGRGTIAIEVEPLELRNLISLLNALPKDTQQSLRDKAQPLSKRFAGQLLMFSHSSRTPQAKLVAESLSTPRDRLIRVDIGGAKKVGRAYGGEMRKNGKKVKVQRAAAGALLWGSEFGSHPGLDSMGRKYTNRFGAQYRKSGYWINPAVDYYTPIVAKEYIQIVKDLIKDAGLD